MKEYLQARRRVGAEGYVVPGSDTLHAFATLVAGPRSPLLELYTQSLNSAISAIQQRVILEVRQELIRIQEQYVGQSAVDAYGVSSVWGVAHPGVGGAKLIPFDFRVTGYSVATGSAPRGFAQPTAPAGRFFYTWQSQLTRGGSPIDIF
jgi:hypothetical protein